MAMAPPPDLLLRLQYIFQRMAARGMLEPIQVWAPVTQYDSAGDAVARSREIVETLQGYVATGGGINEPAFEGVRVSSIHQLFFLQDDALSDGNYADRWVILPNRSQQFYRLQQIQNVGQLYSWGMTIDGAVSDAIGNVK